MGLVYDPVSKNASGGTELMFRGLEARLSADLASKISIGRAVMLFHQDPTIRIYWCHNLPGQMNISEVSENRIMHEQNRWQFMDRIVFVSEWQKQRYIDHWKLTEDDLKRVHVLENAITPIVPHQKPKDGPIKLIYTSVPERGLGLLYHVFNELAEKYNIELDVYSSYKIYGIPHADNVHRNVIELCKAHPKINYNTSVPNAEIHKALESAHIFAYPCSFLETSCIAMIEAMSAKCLCVHPDIAGLPETANGHTNMYEHKRIPRDHYLAFKEALENAIIQYQAGDIDHLQAQKEYVDEKYSWDNRIIQWEDYIKGL